MRLSLIHIFILFIVHVWKTAGYSSILYLAAIAGIDAELYEAAEVDGATSWDKIWHITIPGIKMVIIIDFILCVGRILNGDFGLFMQVPLSQGALYSTTNILSTYIYYMMEMCIRDRVKAYCAAVADFLHQIRNIKALLFHFRLIYSAFLKKGAGFSIKNSSDTVSYTHLDVYKRQHYRLS